MDVEEIKNKLHRLDAVKTDEYVQKRYVFNTIPSTASKWIRLRTNGAKTTLAVKEITNDSIDGTQEWEVVVSDFEETLKILEKAGLKPKGYQENKRAEFTLEGCSITIDAWPKIPPYLEIEGKSKAAVEACARLLGYEPSQLTGMNTTKVYKKYGIDLDSISDLRF